MLQQFPPMGVYETLFKFADATAKYMGDPGTHPWAQGYPLTTQLPGGPALPENISLKSTDLKYPKATGELELRERIAAYYNDHYNAGISPDHVAVFAGGRPGILATLAFLEADVGIAVEETEYTPYYDMLKILNRNVHLIPSNTENRFRPDASDYDISPPGQTERLFLVKSNPCNPTGVMTGGDALKGLVKKFSQPGHGALFDEAYEFYCDPEPESALKYIDDIDNTDIFVVGAATRVCRYPACAQAGSLLLSGISKYFAITPRSVWAEFRDHRNCMSPIYWSLRESVRQRMRSINFLLRSEIVTHRD